LHKLSPYLLSAFIVLQALAPTLSYANAALTKLESDLQQSSVAARVAALKNLAALGPAAAPAVPAIIDALNENRAGAATGAAIGRPVSPSITEAALNALIRIGPKAHDAAPYLTPLLKDRNELLRRPLVLQALKVIGPTSEAGSILTRVVGEEGRFTPARVTAIEVLGKVDPPVTEACDMLRELAQDRTDPKTQQAAETALNSIVERSDAAARRESADASIQTLRLKLDSRNPKEDRIQACNDIGELGSKGSPLVPTLMSLVTDRDIEVRHAAIDALGGIGSSAIVAVPSLITHFLAEGNPNERSRFCSAIAKIDPSGKRTIPLLQEALDDPFKARVALEILNELGTDQSTSIAQKARQRWKIRD
jgi:HEAT repeat protein